MSVEALAIALHHSRAATATAKLVLLGVANHDGDGGSWPSVATLARYALCTPRTVQRAVDELERLGEVRRIVQAGGMRHTADHRRPNLYEFLLRCPPDCDRTKNHRTRNRPGPVIDLGDDPEPVHDLSTRVSPVSPVPLTPMSPEPSSEPREKISDADQPSTARELVVETWTHRCIDGSDRHEVTRRTGACAFCAARRIRSEVHQ